MASATFRPDHEREGKVRFPIAAKLVLIISILVLISLGTITALVTFYVSEDVRITAEENNRTVNTRSATAAEAELSTISCQCFSSSRHDECRGFVRGTCPSGFGVFL